MGRILVDCFEFQEANFSIQEKQRLYTKNHESKAKSREIVVLFSILIVQGDIEKKPTLYSLDRHTPVN